MTLSAGTIAWLFACQAIQLALLAGLLILVLRVRRLALGAAEPSNLLKPVVAELAAPLTRLAEQLTAERRELTELTDRANRLVTNLAGAGTGRAADGARAEARDRLQAGEAVDDVVEATGLPSGEVQILANLLQARNEEAETLKSPPSGPIDR